MNIISCVGYYYTGSGAVTDFLKEFSSIAFVGEGEYEIRFVQDPDGISDLAYHVLEDNHRHNTNNAIKRFIKYTTYLNGSFYTKRYRRFFGDAFMDETIKYVDSITELKTNTWWHYDQYEKGKIFLFVDLMLNVLLKKIRKGGRFSLLYDKEPSYYTSIDADSFYKITRDYIDKVFASANPEKKQHIVVEQLVPPSNNERYLRFFNDANIIVVDRDPRDIYLNIKNRINEGVIPIKNVEEFCTWYRITRKHRNTEKRNSRVLFIQFEDFVYHYEDISKLIMEFLGLNEDEHIMPRRFFNPDVSKKGTKLYLNSTNYIEDIKYIEANLGEYLYKNY